MNYKRNSKATWLVLPTASPAVSLLMCWSSHDQKWAQVKREPELRSACQMAIYNDENHERSGKYTHFFLRHFCWKEILDDHHYFLCVLSITLFPLRIQGSSRDAEVFWLISINKYPHKSLPLKPPRFSPRPPRLYVLVPSKQWAL